MNTVTIKFRAKLDTFAGGEGYKVPTLTARHVSFAERDMLATLMLDTINRGGVDITRARLRKFAGFDLPGVVWAGDPGSWTVTPVGNGFMADVTITLPIDRKGVAA